MSLLPPIRWHDQAYRCLIGTGVCGAVALGLDIELRGRHRLPQTGGAVLAITHFSYLDFAFAEGAVWLTSRRLIRFLVTGAAFRNPLVGPLMRSMDHIPVDRNNGRGAFVEAVRRLRAGELVGVFPEGGVDLSYTVRELHPGAVRMAAVAQVPLIPIAIWGGQRWLTRDRWPRWREARAARVIMVVGNPILVRRDAVATLTEDLRPRLQQLMAAAQSEDPDIQRAAGAWWVPAHLGGGAPTPAQAAVLEPDLERRSRPRPEGNPWGPAGTLNEWTPGGDRIPEESG